MIIHRTAWLIVNSVEKNFWYVKQHIQKKTCPPSNVYSLVWQHVVYTLAVSYSKHWDSGELGIVQLCVTTSISVIDLVIYIDHTYLIRLLPFLSVDWKKQSKDPAEAWWIKLKNTPVFDPVWGISTVFFTFLNFCKTLCHDSNMMFFG